MKILLKLSERRITHAEAGAHVFGDQLDGLPIRHRVGLRQVSHCFDQQALAVYIARIRSALAPLASYSRRNRNGKNFGHDPCIARWTLPCQNSQRKVALSGVYPPCSAIFSLNIRRLGYRKVNYPCGETVFVLFVVLSLKTVSGIF